MDHGIWAHGFDEFSAAHNLGSLITEQIDAMAASGRRRQIAQDIPTNRKEWFANALDETALLSEPRALTLKDEPDF